MDIKEVATVHNHPDVEPNEAWCSCCRKSIISGLHNVVRVNKLPEKIVDFKGNQIGLKGEATAKAFYHAQCFQSNHLPSEAKKVIECKYCGVLSMAAKLQDGSKNPCVCSCHSHAEFCSLLIL